MKNSATIYTATRNALQQWQENLVKNLLVENDELSHSFQFYFSNQPAFITELFEFAKRVAENLEALVIENNLAENLPSLEQYSAIGLEKNTVIHHPTYLEAGDIIYGSRLMEKFAKSGGLCEGLALFLLSSHAGEAGHNCPIACSAGLIRLLLKFSDIPDRELYLKKLLAPSFRENYTAAQFLTEIQGGSDVGANACVATQDAQQQWRITGEKWFCSNANAELMVVTARFDETTPGTKGIGLFLVSAVLADGTPNHYHIRRLKQKIGTRSMASGEIDFNGAVAIAIGDVKDGIHLVLENVLHISRIFNAFAVLGMARRAYQIAYYYAKNRSAFGKEIIHYPLVKEQLAKIKAIYVAQLAASFAIAKLQDDWDLGTQTDQKQKSLLRLLANLNKYFTAKYTVENIHHCIDILAGNGAIESFSCLPRLLCDAIVCENWEGTHFTLWMQILRDIEKFNAEQIFIDYIDASIASLSDPNSESALQIATALNSLAANIQTLQQSSLALQTLKIQEIVLQMAAIFSCLCLLKEAEHQQRSAKNPLKQHCFTLFYQIFLAGHPPTYDQTYLDLVDSLVL